jgi:glycerate kinase
MDTSAFNTGIRAASFYAVCDVDNPLLGPRGATRVYGPQKGADPAVVETLEEGMTKWAEVVKRETGHDDADVPGAGAAGGLGFCLKSFFQARLIKGMDALADLIGLESRISQYDLIITGEGKFDRQTESGKVPMGILRLGEKYDIPVVCLCGLNESKSDMGFKKIFSIVPKHASYVESTDSPELSLRKLIRDEVIQWASR